MIWRLVLSILVLGKLSKCETDSEVNEILKVKDANLYENLENKEDYLDFFNEEAKTELPQNFGDEYLHKEINDDGTEDLQFSTANYSSTSEDLDDTRIDNNITEPLPEFQKPEEDYQHNYSTDLSYDNRMYDSFQQSEGDSDCSKQDSESENQSFDAYYPTLIKKSLNNKHEYFSDSETPKATNSVSELKANTENDFSHTRKDSLMTKNNKSYIRFDDSENGRFYLNAEDQTSPEISSPTVPSSTELYTSSDNEYMYNYQPTPPREVESPLHEESDQDENLKKLDNQQLSNYHKKDRHEPSDDLEDADLIPLKQAEGTRKITILKQKTTHSISKEEQETINIHQNPQHRSSSDERIVTESLLENNDSPKHEKIENREETIVFVKGTHIPGKNYGPEDDTFGYYFDTYENQQPDSEHAKQFQTNIKGGPSSESNHRIQYNNHGDGYSTQYFSNSQSKSSELNKKPRNKEYTSPSSRKINQVDPPNTAPEAEITYNFPRNHGKQLVDTNSQHSYNKNNGPAIGNSEDRRHHGENQYVNLSDIDPDQLYIDENTGQLIKFVTEEEAKKLGIKAEYLTNEQIKEYSPTNFEKTAGQDQDYNKQHGSNNVYKQKDEGRQNTKYTHLSSAGQSFHSPVTKQRGGNSYQKQAIVANNNQYHFPSKHASARYNTNSLPFKDNHVVYENEENDANPSHGNIGDDYVLCPKHSSDSIQNQEGNKLNFESPGYSVSNQKSSYNQNNNNNKGSGDTIDDYSNNNNNQYHVTSDDISHPESKNIFTNTNLKGQNFGGNTRDYKGARELDDKPTVLYEPQYDEISFKNGNSYPDNYKSSKGFNNSPNTGIIYEPQDFKKDHSQAPVYKENAKSFTHFPRKTDSVSHVYFEMGHSKNHGLRNAKGRKYNKNQGGFSKHKNNNFGGSNLYENDRSNLGNIQNDENYKVSLQNLFGHSSRMFSFDKDQGFTKHRIPNIQNTGHTHYKGNNNFMPQNELNQFQNQYTGDVLKIPQNSFKGVLENLSGNNMNSGYTFQNSKLSSGYSSGLEGGLEKHGDYKQGEAYIMHNGNLQPIYNGNQKGFSGKNNIQSQAPVEYVVVEVDDDSHGGKDIIDESFLLQHQNNFKGPNIGTMENHPLLVDGGAAYPMEHQNVRYIVDGGKDRTFHLRRMATIGYHMARGVLPQLPMLASSQLSMYRPRSIKGNINFGLQIHKRTGPQNLAERRSDIKEIKKV